MAAIHKISGNPILTLSFLSKVVLWQATILLKINSLSAVLCYNFQIILKSFVGGD